jgi:hypothetical protein
MTLSTVSRFAAQLPQAHKAPCFGNNPDLQQPKDQSEAAPAPKSRKDKFTDTMATLFERRLEKGFRRMDWLLKTCDRITGKFKRRPTE